MKKIILFLLACVLTGGIFCSCSKDDNEVTEINNASFNVNYLYGKWNLDKVDGITGWVLNSRYENNYITFNRDGTAHANMAIGNGNVKYKVNGNIVTLYVDGGDLFYITVNSISSTDMDVKAYLYGNSTALNYTFKK